MLCACFLHFNLHATVLRVDVIKDFFAGFTRVEFNVAVKVLIDVNNGCNTAEAESQIVEACSSIFTVDAGSGCTEVFVAEEKHRAEIEIVAERALLIVNYGRRCAFAFGNAVVVGIEHAGLRVGSYFYEAVDSEISGHEMIVLGIEENVVGIGGIGDFLHCCR